MREASRRDYFKIPDCAWKRALGGIPSGTASSCPDRGVALGGFGAGSFMYSISGSFGPWSLKSGAYDQWWLDKSAFHIREKVGTKEEKIRTLSTNPNLKSKWEKLKKGDAAYYALQPKGWVTYDCFDLDISQKFFSPIIPHNYKETSYPAAVWQFKVSNPTKYRAEATVLLTWQQAPFSGDLPRKGCKNYAAQSGDVIGVVMKASHPENVPETQDSEWCIAAKSSEGARVIRALDWIKEEPDSAAMIAVEMSLEPGESRTVPIVISWDFPVVKFGDPYKTGTEWWRKYTEYFGRDAAQSFNIAKEALLNYAEWEKQVDGWMQPVIESDKYPEWLKTAAFNELYYTQFGGTFYESGLKSGHDREYMGLHEDDHKFFVMECMQYPFCETFDVRHYCAVLTIKFWPEIERDILRCAADGIMHFDALHQTPHDFGAPKEDPFFKFDTYGTNKLHWKDLHAKFIQQVARYYHVHNDKKFLDYCWPAVKMTYEYMRSQDTDGDCLPNNNGSDNTYDAWGLYGTSLLCGGLWVGALEAMEKLALAENDPVIKEVISILHKAKENLDKQLWSDKKQYYMIDTAGKHSDAIMADGLNGQRYCEVMGLDDILPRERMVKYLKKVYEMCVVPLQDYNGDGVGDCGAMNSRNADGTDIDINMAKEIWPGSTYFLAATMYRMGLKEEALKTAYGCYYMVYEHEKSAYWFNTPEAWHDGGHTPRPTKPEQYQRARAVWELLLEIHDPF
jgi:non-lysosomal glucosylceramidase